MSIKGVNPVPFVLLIITASAVIAIPSLAPVAAYALKLAFIVGFAWTFHEVMVKNSRVNRQKREMAAMAARLGHGSDWLKRHGYDG